MAAPAALAQQMAQIAPGSCIHAGAACVSRDRRLRYAADFLATRID
jgi:hypothetical protein